MHHSVVAFFHKHMNFPENRFKAANRMRKEVRRIQRIARRHWFRCDKCRELFKEAELEQITIAQGVDEQFCKTCIDMMKIARDEY